MLSDATRDIVMYRLLLYIAYQLVEYCRLLLLHSRFLHDDRSMGDHHLQNARRRSSRVQVTSQWVITEIIPLMAGGRYCVTLRRNLRITAAFLSASHQRYPTWRRPGPGPQNIYRPDPKNEISGLICTLQIIRVHAIAGTILDRVSSNSAQNAG